MKTKVRRSLRLVVLSFVTGCASTPIPKTNCELDFESALTTDINQPYADFDQTKNSGWRRLDSSGCYEEAADLIEAYIEANEADEMSLVWHIAQLRASAGDYERAIVFASKSLRESEELDERQLRWNDYVRGTIAFLRRDKAALVYFRNQVAAGVDDYVGNENNARILDLLISNYELSYLEASSRPVATNPVEMGRDMSQ